MSMQSAHPEPQRNIRLVEQSRVETHPDGHVSILLPSNHVMGFRPTPDSGGEAGTHVAAALDVLHKAEAQAKANGGISKKEWAEYVETVNRSAANVESFERAVAKAERELYTPPKPELVEALLDMEIRNDARLRHGTASRGAAFQAIHDDERVMLAIVRSPLPLPYFSEVAKAVWRARVVEKNPDKVAKIQKQRESVEWARGIIHQASEFVKRLRVKRDA